MYREYLCGLSVLPQTFVHYFTTRILSFCSPLLAFFIFLSSFLHPSLFLGFCFQPNLKCRKVIPVFAVPPQSNKPAQTLSMRSLLLRTSACFCFQRCSSCCPVLQPVIVFLQTPTNIARKSELFERIKIMLYPKLRKVMSTSKRAFLSKSPILKQTDRLPRNGVTVPHGCSRSSTRKLVQSGRFPVLRCAVLPK